MSLRWLVYSAGEELGPWSASRIRDELRAGRIDAFDMVAVEGGQIKRPLMEVDEIFENSRIQAAAFISEGPESRKVAGADFVKPNPTKIGSILKLVDHSANQETANNSQPPESGSDPKHILKIDGAKIDSSHLVPERPRAFEALAAKEAVLSTKKVVQRHGSPRPGVTGLDARRYVLWRADRGSEGPFSSREILALWRRQKISPATTVQRLGNDKRIAVSQFVRFYEKNQPPGAAILNQAQLVIRAKTVASWWLMIAIVLAAGIIVAAFFYSSTVTLTGPILDPNSPPVTSTVSKDPGAILTPEFQVENPLAQPSIVPARESGLVPSAKAEPPRSVTKPRPSSAKVRVSRPGTSPYRTPPKKSAPTVSAWSAPAALVTPLPSTSSGPPVTPLRLVDGATVTLTGYRFNVGQLNACEMKCKIPMTGAQGAVTAVFFKEAFGAAFAGKSAGVTISGTVRKDAATNAIQILVQQVK